jgi:predicted dehydrogenase
VLCEKPLALNASDFTKIRALFATRSMFAVHNYRYKKNVVAFLRHLAEYNPGELRTVRLHFDSPAVDFDGASWLRDEMRARTLLLDYALHFIDLACMFSVGGMDIRSSEVRRNSRGQTESIDASLAFANHTVHIFLRQGARQRQCRIEYVFQNCLHILGFFPDTFRTVMGHHTFGDELRAAYVEAAATAQKVAEKLRICRPDASHEHVLAGFLTSNREVEELSMEKLAPFYENILKLAERIYGESQ